MCLKMLRKELLADCKFFSSVLEREGCELSCDFLEHEASYSDARSDSKLHSD